MRYIDSKGAADTYTVSRQAFSTIVKEIEKTGRYPEGAVIRQAGKCIVLSTVFHDFMRNRFALQAGLTVPAYSAQQVQQEMNRLEA